MSDRNVTINFDSFFSAIFGSSEAASKTSLINVMMQLRKAIGHPYLFPGIEPEPFEMGEHLSESKIINHSVSDGSARFS